jgi:prepilin-type N-terminal cleavage/methylation domain-containing protein
MNAETKNITAGDGGLRAEGERRTLGVPRIRKDRSSPYPEAFGVNLRNSSPAAFSLVELLFVLAIVSILAGLVVGTAKYASTKAATSRAQSEIAAIEMALEHYKNDNGAYPPSTATRNTPPPGYSGNTEIFNSGSLYTALAGGPKFYLNFRADQIRTNKLLVTRYIVDPFGNPYNYYHPPPPATGLVWSNQATFDLWSYGPDGINDTADDIVNWRQ